LVESRQHQLIGVALIHFYHFFCCFFSFFNNMVTGVSGGLLKFSKRLFLFTLCWNDLFEFTISCNEYITFHTCLICLFLKREKSYNIYHFFFRPCRFHSL